MSELGDYRRLVEQPMIAGYEATIASLRAEIERSQDALQQLVDYIKDGCPDDGQYYVMTEAQAALKGIKVVQPASPLRGREPDEWELAKFLCEKLAIEVFDKMSRTKYLGDAKAVLEFLSASPPEQATPAVGGEATSERLMTMALWQRGKMTKTETFNNFTNGNLAEEAAGEIKRLQSEMDEWQQAASVEAGLRREFLARAELAEAALAPPASPLRGRESVREIAHRHCTCTCRDDPSVLQNHTNLCDSIADSILEYAALFSAPPEQPAATPDIVKMYSDMERAKNARIGELEEALGKAVLSAPPVRQLTENERDAIAHAKYQCDCSSPRDPEVRFDYEVIRTLLSLIPVPKEAT